MNKFFNFYNKRVFYFILFVFMSVYAFGHDGETHKVQMCAILFQFEFGQNEKLYKAKYKEFERRISEKELKKIEMLDSAAYLAIDFYNKASRGKKDLRALKNAHVKNLPVSISEINYKTSPNKHQYYTHRGWNVKKDESRWKKRKPILLNTAAKIFDKSPHAKEMDAFCALIYYCHVLGDHEGDEQINSLTRMALGGRADRAVPEHREDAETILDELTLNVIPVLFGNNGTKLVSQLKDINAKVDKLMRRNKDDSGPRLTPRELTPEEYLEYQKYATQTLRLLQRQIPVLLQQQAWFTEAFPSAKKL